MDTFLAGLSASISEFKKNPSALIEHAGDETIAILNHNRPTAYVVPARAYEAIIERLDDLQLAKTIYERAAEKESAVELSLDDL